MRLRRNFDGMNTKTPHKRSRSPLTRFQESTSSFDAIDEEAGVIRGVRILNLNSRNGRRYSPDAARAAVPLYEGARVYLDHVKPNSGTQRKTHERWGKLVNVSVAGDGGLVGDLEYLKTHPETEQILESIRRFRDTGLSHDAAGRTTEEYGETVVTEIVKLHSVDLVQEPATTKHLFESRQPMKRLNLLSVLQEHKASALASRLLANLQEMEDVFADGDETMADMEMEMDEEMMADDEGGDYAVGEAFKTAMMYILENDGMDTDAKIEKLRMLLDVKAEVNGSGVAEAVGAEGASDEIIDDEMTEGYGKMKEGVESFDVAELASLREELRVLKATESSRKLLESVKREVTDVRLRALVSVPESDRKALAESWPLQESSSGNVATNRRPAVSPSRVQESRGTEKLPENEKEFRERLGLA